jgi:glycosyltransferase involved in cell wall biosynthesis
MFRDLPRRIGNPDLEFPMTDLSCLGGKKVVHLTSVHSRFDTRIYCKQCISLVEAGCQVTQIVADGLGNQAVNGIQILDVGKSSGRVARAIKTVRKIGKLAQGLSADLFQMHDPELLQLISLLKKTGAKVVFDSHEDLPKQVLSKPYLNPLARQMTALAIRVIEPIVCRRLDAILGATTSITTKFRQINSDSFTINNYPRLDEFVFTNHQSAKKEVVFVGGISRIRGIRELIQALSLTPGITLNLAGGIPEIEFEKELRSLREWSSVNYLGYLDRPAIAELMETSMAGIVTFLPVPNHIEAQPNKMFEYMAAGLPIIASDFPLWRDIIDSVDCGLLVDPEKPSEIADAINWIASNPEAAKKMGDNGRQAIKERFNWESEQHKLFDVYRKLLC